MTLSNQERAIRCQQAITAYSDDDVYTNLVDFLTDAFHWCRVNGHSLADAFETALMHFEAEITGDDILDDLNSKPTNERNQPMTEPKTNQHDQRKQLLRSVTDEALDAFWQVIVQRYPQAESGDLSPWATITLSTAAENAIGEWIDNNVPATTTTGD
jgi:hypothetical protein